MIPEAKEVPEIRAAERGDDFTTAAVFTVEREVGLWRQISREGRQGIKTPVEDAVVAHVGEQKLIELVRWVDLENALALAAGLEVIPANAEGEPVA